MDFEYANTRQLDAACPLRKTTTSTYFTHMTTRCPLANDPFLSAELYASQRELRIQLSSNTCMIKNTGYGFKEHERFRLRKLS